MRKKKERCIHKIDFEDLCKECESIIEKIEYRNLMQDKKERIDGYIKL